MIRAHFLKELLEVVFNMSYLALAIACGLCGVIGTRATHLLIDAAVYVGCGLLAVLLAPLLASLGCLLGTLDGDVGQCFPTADWGWSKSRRIATGGVMGGDSVSSFGGALGGLGQRVEGLRNRSVMCVASGRPCQRSSRIMVKPPLSTRLIIG
jgi:hypothetical protein